MKTRKFVLTLLAVAFTVGAFATKIPKMNVVALDDAKALISAEIDPTQSSEISIVAEDGQMVYYKKSKASSGFKSIFDLSDLENGTYTVKIKTGTASATREVEVTNGQVDVKPMKTQIDPFFAYDGDLLKLSYLNFEGDNLTLIIYNGSTQVFESKLGTRFNIQQGYDVSDLVKGNYDVVLVGTNENYNYRISR